MRKIMIALAASIAVIGATGCSNIFREPALSASKTYEPRPLKDGEKVGDVIVGNESALGNGKVGEVTLGGSSGGAVSSDSFGEVTIN